MGLFGGSSSTPTEQQQAQPQQSQQQINACEPDQKAFLNCLEKNPGDVSTCQFYMDMFNQCRAAQANTFQ